MARDGITIVVPTLGRERSLRRLLDAISALTDPGLPFGVVVVDNSATGLGATAGRQVARLPVPAILVHEGRRGASAARNRGLREVETALVAFLDDDVVPDRGWLAALVEPLRHGASVVGGVVRLDPGVALPAWLDVALLSYLSSFDRGPVALDLDDDDYLLTANLAAETELVRAAGCFDEVLGPRPGEQLTNDDVDLCRRLVRLGARLRYEPTAIVVHDVPPERVRRRYLVSRAHHQGRSDWLLDRADLAGHPSAGLRRAASHLRATLPHHVKARPVRPATAMRVACDVARASGLIREAVAHR